MKTLKLLTLFSLSLFFTNCNNDIVTDDMELEENHSYARRKVQMTPEPGPNNRKQIVSGGSYTFKDHGFACKISWPSCELELFSSIGPTCSVNTLTYEGTDESIIPGTVHVYNNQMPQISSFNGINQLSEVCVSITYKKRVTKYTDDGLPYWSELQMMQEISGSVLFSGYYQDNTLY